MAVSITVCTSCKAGDDNAPDAEGRCGGERLAAILEIEAGNRTGAPRIIRHECLWACTQSCTVLIEAGGKTGYLAGRFVPDRASAEALFAWAEAYEQSPDGSVRYRDWPEGIKGHFIARIPVRPEESQS